MLLYIVGGLAGLLVILVLQRRLASKPRDVKLSFDGFPSRRGSVLGIALNILLKRQGRFFSGFKDIPNITFTINNAGVREKDHSIYERLVAPNSQSTGNVLPCFITALMFKVWARCTSLPEWPLSPLGLIHYKTVIKHIKDIKVGEPLTVEVRFGGCRQVEKGIEIDANISSFNSNGEKVMEAVWTVLSRGGRSSGPRKPAAPETTTPVEYKNSTEVKVASGLGVRFSFATGDISPQHMYGLTAMLIGFKKPIVQGMWTLERIISDIREKGDLPSAPFTVESYFKLPIFIPSTIRLEWTKQANGSVEFRVASPDGKPHMTGTIVSSK